MPEEPQVATQPTSPVGYCIEQELEDRGPSRCLYELLTKVVSLSGGQGLEEVLHELAPPLQRITGCDTIDFSLHNTRQDCFSGKVWKKSAESSELKVRREGSISAWVWGHQKPLVIADLSGEVGFVECVSELRALGLASYTALPMTTSVRRIGVLGLGFYKPQALEIQSLDFLLRIARIVTLALENREILNACSEQHERLHGLLGMTHELTATRNLEEIVPVLLGGLQRVLPHDGLALALLEGNNQVRLHTMNGRFQECLRVRDHLFSLEEIPSGGAIKTGKPILLNAEGLRQTGALGKSVAEAGIQTVCSVPLISGGRVWGSISIGSSRINAFGEDDAEYLQQIGSQVAAALANADACREIASLKGRLAEEKSYLENEIQNQMSCGEMVGGSAGLKRVLEAASVVARTDATVMITGETGTGKERVARVIHEMSGRKGRSFIKLNCAAIPTGLLESELFGHEKGAFTGAVSQKIGRLELADKGTLFLDEIGDIPLELQPKLLRVLQDYEFERLGGTRTIHVNVRLIAATNRDLGRAVEEKQFRRDLFYRLHVFPIHLPALRERREDIPLLVQHFVAKSAQRIGKRIDVIPDATLETMMKWDWPGNIRELENFVERSVILSQNRVLHAPLMELQGEMLLPGGVADDTLQGREREHIIQMLRQTRGILSGATGAAARLGLKRTTLQYRMQKLGISRIDYLD